MEKDMAGKDLVDKMAGKARYGGKRWREKKKYGGKTPVPAGHES
jgi:hypothetical protein